MSHSVRHTSRKIAQRLHLIEPLVHRHRHQLAPFHYRMLQGPLEAPPIDGDTAGWDELKPGTFWGASRTDFMMRGEFSVPAVWDKASPVALYLPLGEAGNFSHPEALVYIDGEPYAACDRHHQEIALEERWRDGQLHRLALHGWTGLELREDKQLFMRSCAVVSVDEPTRQLVAISRVSLGIAQHLEANHPAKGLLLNALDEAFKLLDLREPFGEGFYASVPHALERLQEGVGRAGPALPVDIVAVGHAHIDVAWLWTLGQTRRKSGRTFHTVLRLMEQFPDYRFTQSQPQLYDYVKRDYPELFEAIGQRIAEGRWETIGGMWVEADCNLSGSESLARQFLLGRSFFKEHFGETESPVLWLPDVFGYAWNLPQLIKQAGLEYFFTIKIGWSQYNRLPYDSFWWQGLDGTKVLTHFSTTPETGSQYASTYNASATPEQALGTWRNFQQKELQQELLMAFGYGDGGGGPTREMLENIKVMRDFPGTPRLRHGTVKEFFENLEKTSGDALPTWNGELYLELHRGTYTTQSRNKRANRKSEFLLHDAEFLASYASLLEAGYSYPAEGLRGAWELVCLNQFHDIIPGSSIGPVYSESLEQYEEVRNTGERVRDKALEAIGRQLGGDYLLVNPTGFVQDGLALLDGDLPANQGLKRADGQPVLHQPTEGGTLLAAGPLPPYSVTALELTNKDSAAVGELKVTPTLLENAFVRVELNEGGDVTRIYDKLHARELLPEGEIANQFQAFEDRPMNWDAWDVDIFYDDKMWLAEPAASVRVLEEGPLRATLEIERRILNSAYTQRLSLTHSSPQLDIDTDIDWQEKHVLLKVAFPVDVLSPTATYEIQWGNVARPTHRNTSWDWARFETCAQKWVDLSEGGYGASLLNDCKYGHDIRDNVMRLSLLRSPTYPDPEADRGRHRFAYSLLPHAGGVSEATVAAAYLLNDPLLVVKTAGMGEKAAPQSLLASDQTNIVLETIKRAEDGDGIIVRLYESQRQRGPITLRTGFTLQGAWRTNLLEENAEALGHDAQSVTLMVKPFEIVTLRLRAEKAGEGDA